jgi:hypothetical protein
MIKEIPLCAEHKAEQERKIAELIKQLQASIGKGYADVPDQVSGERCPWCEEKEKSRWR